MYGFELPIVFVRFLAVIKNLIFMGTLLVHYGPLEKNNRSDTGAMDENQRTGFLPLYRRIRQ